MARIVVIDDDAGIRRTIARVLGEDGHDVGVAEDGIEGLRLVDAAPAALVIVDIVMPLRDGVETIRALRQRHPPLPILAVSGGSLRLDRDEVLLDARQLGATALLPKPFTPSELRAAVAWLLYPPTS